MSCSIPALPGGSPPFPASQVHLYLTRRLPGAIPFLCMCPLGSPPAPSPCPRSCYRCLHTHGSQPEDRVGTSNAQHLFWRLTDGDKYNHSLCWSFSQSILLVFFVVFFSPPPYIPHHCVSQLCRQLQHAPFCEEGHLFFLPILVANSSWYCPSPCQATAPRCGSLVDAWHEGAPAALATCWLRLPHKARLLLELHPQISPSRAPSSTAKRSHKLPWSWLHAAGQGFELGSLRGQEREGWATMLAHISSSKCSCNQKVPPKLSAEGFHLSMKVLWQRSSPQAAQANVLCRENDRERGTVLISF